MRGHLRRRGSAWELRVFAGRDPVSNRKTYRTRSFRGSKRDAEAALAKFVLEVGGGGHAALDTTVGELIRQWFELARADLSPSTVRGYERSINSYILPKLGNVPLDRLRVSQIDRFYAELREGGGEHGGPLATATVRQVHAVLRRALQQGVRWGWTETNPATLASPPRVRNRQIESPDPIAVVRLIEAARTTNPDLATFLHVAVTTGARRGELCGLHWNSIDFEAGTVIIARSVIEGSKGAILEKDTKTHAVRRVAVDTTTIQILREHQVRCRARAEACGTLLPSTAYVFSRSPDGAAPWVPNEVTKAYISVRKSIGLQSIRLHDLRHFAATRLLAAGIPVRTVSGRLGHSNASSTLGVYAHFLVESDRDAADTLEELLKRSSSPGTVIDGSQRANRSKQRGPRSTK